MQALLRMQQVEEVVTAESVCSGDGAASSGSGEGAAIADSCKGKKQIKATDLVSPFCYSIHLVTFEAHLTCFYTGSYADFDAVNKPS